MNSKIISTGSYLPKKILTNDDLSKMVETSDEWITERTGIKKRHIAADNELTSDLAYNASMHAITDGGINKDEIDLIIVATTTADRTFPSTATILQKKLGINEQCFAFDVQAVCSGFIYALTIADKFIKTGQAKKALVVGAETISRIIDWKDRNTCVLFGDGAGVVILENAVDEKHGILSASLHSDGQYGDLLQTTGGVSLNQQAGFVIMEGKEIFKLAVNKMTDCVLESLNKVGLKPKDINLIIPHQANLRILNMVAQKLGLNEEQMILTIKNQANTSAASIPLAIDYAVRNNKIKEGDLVVLEALGGGLTWGSIVIKW
jgi:3-oxoacyl-[acyl-carrier-protein] synthase III